MERLQRKLDFARHKEPPRPIETESAIVTNKIYLYGVDYMSTMDIKQYFERFATSQDALTVAWLNDSSCTVQFESDEMSQKAYTDCALSAKPGDKPVMLHIGQAVVDGTSGEVDKRNFDPLIGWKEALGF